MADFELISHQALSGAVASVSFPNLGLYKHLYIVIIARGSRAQTFATVFAEFNGDTGNNYYNQRISGGGTTNSADEGLPWAALRCGFVCGDGAPAAAAGVVEVWIPDYRGTTLNKGVSSQSGWKEAVSVAGMHIDSNYSEWASTAAITSILLRPEDGNFMAGSIFSLYGIR